MESGAPRTVRAKGLSLVELLVALSLLSVVTLMGWLMLASIRNIADELLTETPDTLDRALSGFENDLAHLVRSMAPDGDPDFQLDPDGTAKWLTTAPGEHGRDIPLEVTYLPPDNEGHWRRAVRFPGQTQAQTNLLHSAVQHLALSAYLEENLWSPKWPPETTNDSPAPGNAPPRLLRFEVETTDGTRVHGNFLIPAAMRIDPPDTEDQISN